MFLQSDSAFLETIVGWLKAGAFPIIIKFLRNFGTGFENFPVCNSCVKIPIILENMVLQAVKQTYKRTPVRIKPKRFFQSCPYSTTISTNYVPSLKIKNCERATTHWFTLDVQRRWRVFPIACLCSFNHSTLLVDFHKCSMSWILLFSQNSRKQIIATAVVTYVCLTNMTRLRHGTAP